MNRRYIEMLLLIVVLAIAPVASAQLPALQIDLDRNTAGVQVELDKAVLSGGDTIQGALHLTGTGSITKVEGFQLRVDVAPTGSMDSVSTAGKGADTSDASSDYFEMIWLQIPIGTPDKIDLPGEVFTFDLVLPSPLPSGDITFSSVTTADSSGKTGITTDIMAGSILNIDGTVIDIPTSIISEGQAPTDTPTDAVTETPTITPTFTFTDIPTDTPTDGVTETPTITPTNTPTAILTDTPTDTPTESEEMGYVLLDGYGAQHLQGTAVALMPDFNNENELFPWFGVNIARDIEFLSDNSTRVLLSGYGQVATVVKGATTTYDNSLVDMMDDKCVSIKPSSSGGYYILDKYGEVIILGSANNALAGVITGTLLPGGRVGEVSEELLLRAVDLEVNADEDTVYVLDSFGGVHIQGANAAERGALTRTYFGWDIARDLEFFSANEYDCVLDGLGGIHAVSGESLPEEFTGSIPGSVAMSYHYFGWDIARDVEFTPDFKAAWKLDGFGVAHNCGLAPVVPGLWFGWDISIDLEIYLGETQF